MKKILSCLLIAALLVTMAGAAFSEALPEENGSAGTIYVNTEPAEAQTESPAMLPGAHQHKTFFFYTPIDEEIHETVEYCPTCDDALGMFTEEHTFEDGECVYCGEPCPHNGFTDVTATPIEETIEWDGENYITYEAIEKRVCRTCGTVLSEETVHCSDIHQAQNHVCGEVLSYISDGEWNHVVRQVCSICHSEYTTLHPHNCENISAIQYGAEGHTYLQRCVDCKATRETKPEAHQNRHCGWIPSKEGDIEQVECEICSLAYELPMIEHDFEHYRWTPCEPYGGGVDIGHREEQHCKNCGKIYTSEKIYDHQISGLLIETCVLCGAADHEHYWLDDSRDYVDVSSYNHIVQEFCIICMEWYNAYPQNHTFDPYTLVCTKCGHQKDECLHDSDAVYATELANDESHTVRYTCRLCGNSWTLEYKHNYKECEFATQMSTADAHYRRHRCTECGYEKYIESGHNMQKAEGVFDEARTTSTSHWQLLRCTDCGYEDYIEEKHSKNYNTVSDTKHDEYCSMCGYDFGLFQHNLYESKDGTCACCFECGYVDHVHNMVFESFKPSGDDCVMHLKCDHDGCDKTENRKQEHESATRYTADPSNADCHSVIKYCGKCGKELRRSKEAHHFADGSCTQCGYTEHVHHYVTRNDDPRDPHRVWDECDCGSIINERQSRHSYSDVYEPFTAEKHIFRYACTVCGFEQYSKTEDHVLDHDVCLYCGYRRLSSGGINDGEDAILPGGSADRTPGNTGGGAGPKAGTLSLVADGISWYTLYIDEDAVSCDMRLESVEETGEHILTLLPQSDPDGEKLCLKITAEGMRILASGRIDTMRIRLAGEDLLISDRMSGLYAELLEEYPDARKEADVLIEAPLAGLNGKTDGEIIDVWEFSLG